MTLASALWLMACVVDSKALDRLDAAQVARLVAAALHVQTADSFPRLAGDAGLAALLTALLTALTKDLGAHLPTADVDAFGRDPKAALAAVDEKHRVRAVTAHALVYATVVPSNQHGDGRLFFLRPDLVIHLPTPATRALEAMARERCYLTSTKVAPFLKRWSHKKAWLDDALTAWALHPSPQRAVHLQRTAAWLRASRELPVESLARVLDAHASP